MELATPDEFVKVVIERTGGSGSVFLGGFEYPEMVAGLAVGVCTDGDGRAEAMAPFPASADNLTAVQAGLESGGLAVVTDPKVWARMAREWSEIGSLM